MYNHEPKKKWWGFLLITFAFACTVQVKEARTVNNQDEFGQLIQKHYPRCTLMSFEELDHYAKEFFKDRYPHLSPSLISADFDGNALSDFAFLLQTKSGKSKKTIFVILLQMSNNDFKPAYYLDLDGYRPDVFIVPIQKGELLSQAESIDTPREKVLLKHPAIELVYVGKSAVVYYWDVELNRFNSIWISD